MKVAHVMGRFASNGTERQLLSTMAAAIEHNLWQPTLVLLRPGGPLVETAREAGVRVVEMRGRSDRDPRRLIALRKLVREGHFDIVHSSLWGANAVSRVALLGPSRPSIVISERRVEDFRHPAATAVDRMLSNVTDWYIGNSQAVVDFISREHSVIDRVSLIPNGIDTSIFYPRSHARTADLARIGAMGRLEPVKGFDILIEAARVLGRTDMTIEIVGDGPLRQTLSGSAAELPVTLRGPIADRRALGDWLRSLDLFVMPSHTEGLPNAVLEASACGLPVIATDSPGILDALPGATLLPAGNISELAQALGRWLNGELHISALDSPAQSFEQAANAHLCSFEAAITRRHDRNP